MKRVKEVMEYIGYGMPMVAFVAGVIGAVLMEIASIQKYGWTAAFADDSNTSLFAIETLWEIEIYRVGFIMSIVGFGIMAIFMIHMRLTHPDQFKK